MKISVITVCYNSARTIRETLESVRSQTHGDVEHILVDGLSSDGTWEIIKEYETDLGPCVREADDGIYDAINKGIGLASGEVVGILNADDVYTGENVLTTVSEAFGRPDTDVVYGDVVFVRSENPEEVVRYYSSRRFSPWKLRFGWMPPHPATFVRKEVYEKLGLYRTNYSISADYEFMVRSLYCARTSCRRVDKVLVKMRMGGASTRSVAGSWRLNREIVRACRENGMYTNMLLLVPKVPYKLSELTSAGWRRAVGW